MELEIETFISMLENIKIEDIPELAANSSVNHHTEGLFYICLKRTEKETIKVYFMPDTRNDNSGFLVHPHNHRYDFDTIVLAGEIKHYRFEENEWGTPYFTNARYFSYCPEDKKAKFIRHSNLDVLESEEHIPGDTYHVSTNEIHTIKMTKGKVILGLIQYADKEIEQKVFIPTTSDMGKNEAVPMTYTVYVRMVKQVLDILRS